MNYTNLIWLVFLFLAIQPLLASRWLKAIRAAKLDRDNKTAPAKLTLVRNLLASGAPAKPKS